jgi:hypothetical protein
VSTCPKCGETIEDGVLHSCGAGTLRAPWLLDELKAQTAELVNIRELLTVMAQGNQLRPVPKNPESKKRGPQREIRTTGSDSNAGGFDPFLH